MSRRKQARPRHLDDDVELGTSSTADTDNVFAVKSLPETLKLPMSGEEETEQDDTSELEHASPQSVSPNSDAHVCGKCRAEFLELSDFIAHKKECSKEKVVILYDQNQTGTEDQSELCNINGVSSRLSEDQEIDNLEAVSQNGGSDGEHSFEKFSKAGDEVDAGVGLGEENLEEQSESALNEMEEDELKSLVNDDDDNIDDDLDSLKDDELEDEIKPELNNDIPPYMLPLAHLLPNANVMLEPLQATKAAVAQFAENNLPTQDANALHGALFNLQQQQIMQLQLIHQLQQQLIANGAQNGQLPSGLLNGRLNLANLGLNLPFPVLDGKNQVESKSPPPDDDDEKLSETESLAEEKSEENSISKSSVTTPPSKPSESPAVSSKISSKETPPSPQLPQSLSTSSVSSATQEKPSPSSATQSTPPTPALDFSRTSKLQEEQFVSDDPFFKHKCRLCHKVFGSDSALQIHIRSHTDAPAPPTDPWVVPVLSASDFWTWEKPFKCNVCGGRFSTRGNLKVHFQRHKAEFPDIEMNPNPVPEHLDKTPNPFLASPFPTAALNPFATPAGFMGLPGLMNGLMFPSPHLAPRLPFGHPHIPNRPPVSDEKRPSSPRLCSSSLLQVKKETSPTQTAMEAPKYSSPNVKEGARIPSSSLPPASHTSMPSHFSNPSPVMPISSIPLVSNYPVMSPLPSRPPFPAPRPPSLPPSSNHGSDPFRSSILPANVLDNDDNLEQFMEIDKSETCKLQQLVDNIEHKLTDPNQCVICHRVLSCKSALQMHYRIHTGERPFKCKICGRSFTTKGNLKTHMGVHRAKPPLRMMHQCPVCHKQFTNLLVLQQHIRSHTGMANLPSIPNLSHIGMFGRSGPDFDPSGHQKPLNMTRPFPDYDRELDLSNKRPRLDTEERNENKLDNLNESLESFENDDNIDDVDDEQNEMDSIDEEANAQAAKDAENGRDLQGENLSLDRNSNESDAKAERPTANENADFYRRSPTPKYLQEAPSPSSESQNGTFNSYSTSLAALEERVRAIDSTMARNPLSQFHAAPFLLGPNSEPLSNGKRSLSPKSDSGSEINDKEGIKPSTPALSVSSEGSMGSNFMLGALDLRSQDGNSKNGTTCNVCFKTFACRSALDIHYRSHTKERPYKCDLCDRSFTTRGNMKQHMLTHKIRDSSNDSESSERNNNNSCTPNQNDNTSDNSNDSSNFEETLNLKRELDETVNEKDKFSPEHNENTPMSTSQCSNTRSSHVSSTPSRSSQSGSSPEQSPFISKTPTIKHQCLVCQKGFSSASALQIHIRTHTGDKPFKCNVCGKAFTTKGNLKVHMGTHMWNNSPSRRGRRMSIEPPFMLAHKENPYMPHGFPPRPEFYPFHIPPFMNGLPPKSLNEISVVQGLNNGLHGNHKPDLTSPRSDIVNHKGESPNSSEDGHKYTESGELDLSMKSTGSTGSRDSAKTSPSSLGSSPSSAILSPSQSSSLGWGWKASCHFCSSTFPSPMSLEYHIRTMHKESFHKVAAS